MAGNPQVDLSGLWTVCYIPWNSHVRTHALDGMALAGNQVMRMGSPAGMRALLRPVRALCLQPAMGGSQEKGDHQRHQIPPPEWRKMHFCCSSYLVRESPCSYKQPCFYTDVAATWWSRLAQSQDHMRQSCDMWGRFEVQVSMLLESWPMTEAHGGSLRTGHMGSGVGRRTVGSEVGSRV